MSVSTTPGAARLAAYRPDGEILRSGVATMLETLASDGGKELFRVWAEHPFTRMIVSALDDMAVNLPPVSGSDEVLVQYGVTQGVMLARRLLSDPSHLFPHVFTPSVGMVLPEDDYTQQVDDVADQDQ